MDALVSAPMAFIDISSQCLATVKAASKAAAVLTTLKQPKELAREGPCVIQTCVTIYKCIIINNCSTKFFEICNLQNFNSSKFKFCLSCENFCFENYPLYGS